MHYRLSVLLPQRIPIFHGGLSRLLLKDLVEVGLGAKADLHGDLQHGLLSRQDQLFRLLDPLLGHVFKGRHAHVSRKDRVQMIGGNVQRFGNAAQGAVCGVIFVDVLVSVPRDAADGHVGRGIRRSAPQAQTKVEDLKQKPVDLGLQLLLGRRADKAGAQLVE